jgi:predicted metal-dependent HD superfamily phosphohydrolase
VFEDYEYSIRLEYAHVSEADFARGRATILRQFLSRPTIYYTPHFHKQYETQARLNLERSLTKLRG